MDVLNSNKRIYKTSTKRTKFNNRLKYAGKGIFCICIDVYRIHCDVFASLFECLATLGYRNFNNKKEINWKVQKYGRRFQRNSSF